MKVKPDPRTDRWLISSNYSYFASLSEPRQDEKKQGHQDELNDDDWWEQDQAPKNIAC